MTQNSMAPRARAGCWQATPLLLALILAAPTAAFAHHGIINFDLNREVEFSGTIARLRFVNPHSWLHVDVMTADGRVEAWKCELRGATVLRRSGWTPEMFAPGGRVTITGAPDRFEPNTCYLGTIVFADGTRIDRYGQITRPSAAAAQPATRELRLPNGQPNISGEWAGEQRVLTDPRGISGAFLPLSVARTLEPGAVPDGTQAFPGTRGTAASKSENPVDQYWNQRPSIRPLTEAGARVMAGFDGASSDNPRLRCEPTNILFDWTFESDVNRIVQQNDRVLISLRLDGPRAHDSPEPVRAPARCRARPCGPFHWPLGRRRAGGGYGGIPARHAERGRASPAQRRPARDRAVHAGAGGTRAATNVGG